MSPLGGPETNLPPRVEPGSLYRTEIERALRECVLRWEALARQLGDALTDFASEWEVNEHTNLSGDGGTWADCGECEAPWPCPTERVRAALSVYRDAIKEDG